MSKTTDPWGLIHKLRALVASDYPQYRIGKLELWDREGMTSWKSIKTRKQWTKEQAESAPVRERTKPNGNE